jgi:flagellar biosynthetic protein FlhB
MAEEDRSSKTEAPSQRRLEEARKKGDVAKSPEVAPLAALAGASIVVLTAGPWMARSMAEALLPFIARPDAISLTGNGSLFVMRTAIGAGMPALTILAAAAAAGAAGNLLQHGLLWTPSKLAPDLSRLNIMKALGRTFGLDGLANFLKSLAKLGAVSAVTWMVLKPRAASLGELPAVDPAAILPFSTEILRSVLLSVLIASALIAGADYFWSRHRFMGRMKMSREDLKQEHKDSDGDPHVKARQKEIRMMRSRRRMMQNVPKATVVITNPTHYAVALRYEQGETAAPVCVAKGLDRVALKIREIARDHGVHVVEDPPLARALYAAIDVDESIPREHYEAVAKIIGFVMGARARGRARPTARTQHP